jgi:hypothetical protein
MAQRKGYDVTEFPGVASFLMLLAIIPFIWPWLALHGTARWVVGIIWAVLVDLPAAILVVAYLRQKAIESRDKRRAAHLSSLRAERMMAERHPPGSQGPTAAQRRQQARESARSHREAERIRRQRVEDDIRNEEQLREERRRQ